MTVDRALFLSEVILSILEDPETPPPGFFTLFPKANGKLFMKNSFGEEYQVGDVPGNFADVETDGSALPGQVSVWVDNETIKGFVGFTYDGEKMSLPATGTLAFGGANILSGENGTFSLRNIGFVDKNTADSIKKALELRFSDISGQIEKNQLPISGTPDGTKVLGDNFTWRSLPSNGIPPGSVVMFPSNLIPAGWLPCDGRSVFRASFPLTHAALGHPGGVSAVSYNLPDYSNKFLLGKGTRGIGAVGGAESHRLTVNEMPTHSHTSAPHSHGISDPGHSHSFTGRFRAAGDDNNYTLLDNGGTLATNPSGTGISVNSASIGINNTGGNDPHNNMPPFSVVNFIIKMD